MSHVEMPLYRCMQQAAVEWLDQGLVLLVGPHVCPDQETEEVEEDNLSWVQVLTDSLETVEDEEAPVVEEQEVVEAEASGLLGDVVLLVGVRAPPHRRRRWS